MKKYTQRELLQEGFWKGVGKTVGGIARGTDYIVGKLAPEAQSLYKDPYLAAKGLVRAVKGSPSTTSPATQGGSTGGQTNATSVELTNIRTGLSRNNMTLLNTPTLSYVDPNTRKKYFNVQIRNRGQVMNIIVDENGNYTNPNP